jgi:NADH-quinone oxidoreductase subunit L
MAFALIVLAAGSVLAGYVGIPHALGGSNRLEAFLEPAFAVHEAAAPGAAAADVAAVDDHAGADAGLELALMGVSVAAALGGIGIAFYFFLKNRAASRRVSQQFAGIHTLLENKYYVDEFYDAAIVQPTRSASEKGLWKLVDVGFIDGAVNGVAQAVSGASDLLRRTQTGSVRAYAASLFLGVVLMIGYYLWR